MVRMPVASSLKLILGPTSLILPASGRIRVGEYRQPVRLVEFRGDLGKQLVGRDTNWAGKPVAPRTLSLIRCGPAAMTRRGSF
jgi:hypothetical protein